MKDFSSNCEQIRSALRIWSHSLKKSLIENFIFCAVQFIFSQMWIVKIVLVRNAVLALQVIILISIFTQIK